MRAPKWWLNSHMGSRNPHKFVETMSLLASVRNGVLRKLFSCIFDILDLPLETHCFVLRKFGYQGSVGLHLRSTSAFLHGEMEP